MAIPRFRAIWFAVMGLFFCFAQVFFQMDRYFWFSLAAPEYSGQARVVALAERRDYRFTRYTVELQGIAAAPDLHFRDDWQGSPYDLARLYTALASAAPGDVVTVSWVQPWLGAPYLTRLNGERALWEQRPGKRLLWLLFSLLPVVFVGVALRRRALFT